ncbi:MAG: hypothetical protein KDI71_12020 [Xanthomonadales bacterium]|nr:hypothetical protein [Xanthomonadales bacterium]
MRALGWLFLILIIALGGLLAMLRWQPASVPPSVYQWVPGELIATIGAESPADPAQPAAGTQVPSGPKIYAWQDDQGRWNYTDTPPPDRPYQTRQYREDVNVVPAFEREPEPEG